MSLNKKQMVREIGRRTGLKNRDVQVAIEALIEVWTDELIRGGRIELENFVVLETQIAGTRRRRKISIRLSRALRAALNP